MPDFTNIVTVDLTEATGYNVEAHRAVHQWDSGVILQLTGATFPQGTTCQFDTKTTTFNQELTDGACEIPNALLGYDMIGDIKAHVKIDDDNYGIVVYDIHIPVIRRPKPDSYIYTDNSSSSNGWVKSKYGYRVNEDQTILGRTELSINNNQTILDGTSLSLNNQQTVLDGTHLSLASGLFYADATHLQLNSGRITIGPTQLLVDSRVFGTVNLFDLSRCNNGQFDNNGNHVNGLRCVSDFIAVKEGTSYRVSKPSGIQLYSIVYYDKLQQFKRKITPGADLNYTFSTSTGEVYVRLEFRRGDGTAIPISDYGPIQMEEGTAESAIVTHALDNAELTKRCFLQNFKSKNLVPMGVLQQGGINSDSGGTPFDAQNRCRTDFISVEPDTTYTVSMRSNASPSAVRCYQVKTTVYSTITQTVEHSNTFTFRVPSGCHYIRFVIVNSVSSANNLAVSDITNFQLELGAEATPYQPYALNSSDNCYVNELKSKNLLDPNNIVKGDYDGTNPTIRASVRVNVKPSSAYTLKVSNCYITGVVYLNSSGSVISFTNFGTTTATFVTPASCVIIAAVFNKASDATINPSDVTNSQLEEGPVATPYVPYAMDIVELSAKTKRLFQTYEPLIADGETIPTNVNLNTASYCNIGRYVCPLSTTPATLVNCPTTNAFYMTVRNVTKTDIPTSTLTWQYLLREITDVNGNQYTQTAFCGGTAGSWVFGDWKKIIAGCKTGTLTANTGSFSESYCRQSGDTVDIHGWLGGLSTTTQTHSNAITVSGVSLPSVPVRFVFTCWLGNNIASYAGYGVLDTNGKITLLKAIANSDKVSFTITYIV